MVGNKPAGIGSVSRRHGRRVWLIALVTLIVAAAIAIPLTAYVIIPTLTRSSLVEAVPSASPSAGASTASATSVLSVGRLRQLNAVDFGRGTVKIVAVGTTRYVRFENVEIAGAPDVYVYLSDRTDGQPGNFTNLGRLKATNGSFNYPLPAGLDLAKVHSVVVYCRTFNVVITYALLPMP